MSWYGNPIGRALLGLLAASGIAVSEARAQRTTPGPAMPHPGMGGNPNMGMGGQFPPFPMMPTPGVTSPFMMPPSMMPPAYSPAGYGSAPGGYGNSQVSPAAYPGPDTSRSSGPNDVEVYLTASGVPNEGGKLKWPSALRVLGAPEDEEMRRQTEALFRVAAVQARAGQVNPRLTQELTRTVQGLRARLRADNGAMLTPAVLQEAQRFLDRLERAPELLEKVMATPSAGGTARLQGLAPARPPQ